MIFKKKKIKLNCYTNQKYVNDLFPIDHATRFIPNWFKQIPKKFCQYGNHQKEQTTMKGCVGFTDLYKNSIILPLWCDLEILSHGSVEHPYDIFFGDYNTFASTHPQYQRGNFLPEEKFTHIKIETPWAFSCDESINWTMFQPTYNLENHITQLFILPSVVNYKYTQSRTIHTFIENKEQKIFVAAGTPMLHILPLSERPVEINCKYDVDKYNEIMSQNQYFSFTKKYQNKLRKLFKYKDNK